jgi:hypothetical protein
MVHRKSRKAYPTNQIMRRKAGSWMIGERGSKNGSAQSTPIACFLDPAGEEQAIYYLSSDEMQSPSNRSIGSGHWILTIAAKPEIICMEESRARNYGCRVGFCKRFIAES